MALNIIMAACMYPTLLIIYAVFRGYRNYENHRMFGVTVKKESCRFPASLLTEYLFRR